MRIFLLSVLLINLYIGSVQAQGCCSGGGANPIAGGAATGVLTEHQVEVAVNYQYFQSGKFFVGDRDTTALFDRLKSDYLYLRADYGLSKRLTLSVATGYFLDKTLVELQQTKDISATGLGDLIIFPRYNVINKESAGGRTELTLGLGYKIPLGDHANQYVVYSDPTSGKNYYTYAPPTVQPTNGSQDLLFYSFLYKDVPLHKLRFFASGLYVKKGWNSLGEKFGDYFNLSLYAGKTLWRKLGVTVSLQGELVGQIKAAQNVDLLAFYNVQLESTGSRKLLFVPQLSYNVKSYTFYAVSEIPLYQYLNGVQIGSQYQLTVGVTHRWLVKKNNG